MSIFVGNLPFRAEREDVIQLFAPFGEVLNCSLPLERDTGRKRGFAFIEMADETIESTAIEGLQGTELMGRPLRINKLSQEVLVDLAEEEEAVIMVAATAVVVIVVVMVVVIMAATVVAVLDLTVLTLINLLEQKVGKTEVMEIPLITLNTKMVGAEEKGECPMRAMLQTRQISNPFLQALLLI